MARNDRNRAVSNQSEFPMVGEEVQPYTGFRTFVSNQSEFPMVGEYTQSAVNTGGALVFPINLSSPWLGRASSGSFTRQGFQEPK
jgi:hypothetical protein